MESPVTLITGTSRGIGRALAEHYARAGHRVVGCSRAAAEWSADGYEHHLAEVSDEKAAQRIFAHIRKTFGRLDHLINNAGIASMNHSLLTPLTTVENILRTNVMGTFLFSREAAKLMQTRRFGRIVNLASVAAPLKLEGEAAYAASKAAVVSLTQVMARELADFGITVNAVGPTPVETDLIRAVPPDKILALTQMQAIHRLGAMEDITNVTDFLLNPRSTFVTGQVIYLGGVG